MMHTLRVINAITGEIGSGRLIPQIPDYTQSELMKFIYMNEVEIIAHKVMFGVRLRARDLSTSKGVFDTDLCAGDRLQDWEILLCWFLHKVKSNIELDLNPLKDIPPFTIIKPYFNDPDFVPQLVKYMQEHLN